MVGKLGVGVLIALSTSIAAADKLDDAKSKLDTATDAYNAAIEKYKPLHDKWERYYKPIAPQYEVVLAARKQADDACAKGKRTKNCHDLTLAYAAEHKKYNALVWDKDNADPKHELSPEALKPFERDMLQKKDAFEKVDAATRKLFADAYSKARTKAERDQLDAKLRTKEDKRGDKFAAGRGKEADSKNPPSTSSSSSSSSSSTSPYSDNGAAESARRTAAALGKQ